MPPQYRKTPLQIRPQRKLSILAEFLSWILNSLIVRAFNALYNWNGKQKLDRQLADWDRYFHPLGVILGWNKIYGRRGSAQFQRVLPRKQAEQGLTALLDAIASAGGGSFLAVLKRFGAQESRFSLSVEGYMSVGTSNERENHGFDG